MAQEQLNETDKDLTAPFILKNMQAHTQQEEEIKCKMLLSNKS